MMVHYDNDFLSGDWSILAKQVINVLFKVFHKLFTMYIKGVQMTLTRHPLAVQHASRLPPNILGISSVEFVTLCPTAFTLFLEKIQHQIFFHFSIFSFGHFCTFFRVLLTRNVDLDVIHSMFHIQQE